MTLKAFKEKKSINDIEIDKESLMQLNRATNQFFAQKVKDTIFSNATPKTERKNDSFDLYNMTDTSSFSHSFFKYNYTKLFDLI